MCPDPIRRKGRKTLAKVYDSLSGPEKAPDRSRIIGLPTKKEARDIRNELTAAAWVGGRSVFCQVVIGQCGVSFPSEKAVGFSPVRNWPVIARVLLFHCIRA